MRRFVRSALVVALVVTGLSTASSASGSGPANALVTPSAETPARFDGGELGNADADDPAIYVDRKDPSRSFVIGTLKNGGLDVYDLDAQLLQHIDTPPAPGVDDEAGRFNNVDIVRDVFFSRRHSPTGRNLVDLAVVTDRGRDQLRIYAIDPTRSEPLIDVTAPDVPFVFSTDQSGVNEQTTAYGLATGKLAGLIPVAFVSRRERATVAAVVLVVDGSTVSYHEWRRWSFPTSHVLPNGATWTPCADEDGVEPQFEGMVFDSRTLTLYAAQETVGIWRVGALSPRRPELVEKVREFGVPYVRTGPNDDDEFECDVLFDQDPGFSGSYLFSDAEGLTIYPLGGSGGYLLGSSQGDSTFHVYDLRQIRHIGGYEVVADDAAGIDGADESDGSMVVPEPLGGRYPHGLLVVHDGSDEPTVVDDDGEEIDQTNFKFVPWESVAGPLGLQQRH